MKAKLRSSLVIGLQNFQLQRILNLYEMGPLSQFSSWLKLFD